ncbi:MAG: cell division protein FtsZ [Candidatus Micrarchaeota archaeon]|nr:cell division protein FtsZ [Candidatus Micrarchaeota archaeon]MDE1834093.1 cell division protein FtsZ [Candidatus Micrarchaeota archaeon]MDE1859733.1 cell division protein FtsZ [Candidatus Micrarchaeota archaeon]
MADQFDYDSFTPRVAVVGVGGQGSNLVNRLFGYGIKSATTIAVNTDIGHLNMIKAHRKILIGKEITSGLGAGGFPEVAAKCADVSRGELTQALEGYNLVFIAAGMGGGTGTGAAPTVAKIARETGATVIATVTYPFALERSRKLKADWGLEQLNREADCTIVIENDKLLSYVPNLPIERAFELVDNVTGNAVKGISDCITLPSLINLDYADLKNVVRNTGTAVISIGYGRGQDRVQQAVRSTRTHPLLSVDYDGAKGGLIQVIGGSNLTISEATAIGEGVTEGLAGNANVIFGARMVPELGDELRVMSVITGVKAKFGEKRQEERAAALNVDAISKVF